MMKKLILLALPILFFMTISCHRAARKDPNETEKFCISDSLMKMIKIDTVNYSKVIGELKLIGKITFDEDKVVKIYPLVSGYVTEVKVALGDNVAKGQVMAIIKSSESAGIENDLVTAQANLAISQKNLVAAEDKYKGGIASETEYIMAQKDELKAESELKRVQNIINIYGGNSSSDYVIKAPIPGYVVEKLVNANQQIRPDNSNNLFTVSDLKNVWVVANVYETDIAKIKLYQKVQVTTIAYPDKVFSGKIDKIYNVLDPDNKTMKIRIQVPNNEILLKPEMFASVSVTIESDSNMLCIPTNAIVFDKNKNFVVVYNNKCDIKTREISITDNFGKKTYVSSGLKEGERVISQSQLLIYEALNEQ
jgi:cobalt-zinc-cadmium efflux system membrane fusion protein